MRSLPTICSKQTESAVKIRILDFQASTQFLYPIDGAAYHLEYRVVRDGVESETRRAMSLDKYFDLDLS